MAKMKFEFPFSVVVYDEEVACFKNALDCRMLVGIYRAFGVRAMFVDRERLLKKGKLFKFFKKGSK